MLDDLPVEIMHDYNGNTTQLGPKDLTWDDANRLTSVTVPGVAKSEYQYDGLNRRRIAKAYTWNAGTSDWDLQSERRFIYDGMDLIEERDGSNNFVAFYTRTGNIGEILSRTTASATFYYHYDGNGNVVSLTDDSENVVATYEYDAYGNLQVSSGAEANNNPFRFSTKYFDSSGFYDYGFRFYDPVTGRWLSRDPIDEDGGINLYGFVGNGPVNGLDEYGLVVETGWDIINVGIDVASLSANVAAGNYAGAVVDGLGLIYDGVATAVPVLPGGAGVAIKAARLAKAAKKLSRVKSLRKKFQILGKIPKGWEVHHIIPCGAKK